MKKKFKETSVSYINKDQFYIKSIKHINENVEKYLQDILFLNQGNYLPILSFRKNLNKFMWKLFLS